MFRSQWVPWETTGDAIISSYSFKEITHTRHSPAHKTMNHAKYNPMNTWDYKFGAQWQMGAVTVPGVQGFHTSLRIYELSTWYHDSSCDQRLTNRALIWPKLLIRNNFWNLYVIRNSNRNWNKKKKIFSRLFHLSFEQKRILHSKKKKKKMTVLEISKNSFVSILNSLSFRRKNRVLCSKNWNSRNENFFFFIVILRSFTLVKHRISKTKPKLSQNIYFQIKFST